MPTDRSAADAQPPKLDGPALKDHMLGTYHTLRLGVFWLGVLLPVLLVAGAAYRGVDFQGSMSAYYHTSLRDVFVGILTAVGLLLYLYKGFSTAENVALNLGGAFAVGVAMFPTRLPPAPPTMWTTAHTAFAVAFFVCIGYVAVWRADDTLSLMPDGHRAKAYQRWYRVLGALMVVFPVTAAILTRVVGIASSWGIFLIEAAGVLAFASFWLVKSREMRESHVDELAAAGLLLRAPASKAKHRSPGRLLRAPHDSARAEMEQALRARGGVKAPPGDQLRSRLDRAPRYESY